MPIPFGHMARGSLTVSVSNYTLFLSASQAPQAARHKNVKYFWQMLVIRLILSYNIYIMDI